MDNAHPTTLEFRLSNCVSPVTTKPAPTQDKDEGGFCNGIVSCSVIDRNFELFTIRKSQQETVECRFPVDAYASL